MSTEGDTKRVDPGPASGSRRIARNAFIRSAGEVAAKGGSMVFFILVARVLGAGDFGDLTYALSLVTILLTLSGFGTEALLTREVARDRTQTHHYLSNVAAIKISSSIGLVAIAVLITYLAGKPAQTQLVVLIIGAGVAIEIIAKTWQSVFQAYERMEFISIALVTQRATTAIGGSIALLLGAGLITVSFIYLLGALAGLGVCVFSIGRYIVAPKLALDPPSWWPLLRAALPIGIATLLFTVLLKLDATLLGLIGGSGSNEEVGFYGAAFRLIEGTMFLSWAFVAAVFPWLSRHTGDAGGITLPQSYELGVKLLLVMLAPFACAFVILAPEIIDTIYGAEYAPAVVPLQLLGCIVILYGINYFSSALLTARDQPTRFTRIVAVVAVQNVVQNLILIPQYGADGAAFTAAISGVLLAGLSMWQTASLIGRVRILRVVAGPLVGALAMAALILATDLSLIPTLVISTAAFYLVVAVVEKLANPRDVSIVIGAVRPARVEA